MFHFINSLSYTTVGLLGTVLQAIVFALGLSFGLRLMFLKWHQLLFTVIVAFGSWWVPHYQFFCLWTMLPVALLLTVTLLAVALAPHSFLAELVTLARKCQDPAYLKQLDEEYAKDQDDAQEQSQRQVGLSQYVALPIDTSIDDDYIQQAEVMTDWARASARHG